MRSMEKFTEKKSVKKLFDRKHYCAAMRLLLSEETYEKIGDGNAWLGAIYYDREEKCLECGESHFDAEKAYKYMELAAKAGDTYAQVNYGYMLDPRGKFPRKEKSPEEAIKYYKLAAAKGDTVALRNLCAHYSNGDKPDEEKFLLVLEELIDKDETESDSSNQAIGWIEKKISTPVDIAIWCLRYAKRGKVWAMAVYGKFCFEHSSFEEAIAWLHLAALRCSLPFYSLPSYSSPGYIWLKEELEKIADHLFPEHGLRSKHALPRNWELILQHLDDKSRQGYLYRLIPTFDITTLIREYGLDWRQPDLMTSVTSEEQVLIVEQHEKMCSTYETVERENIFSSEITKLIFSYLPWFALVEKDLEHRSEHWRRKKLLKLFTE